MNDIKVRFNRMFDRFESSLINFEDLIQNKESYLYDCITDVKNKIDVQREELIEEINKASFQMIDKLDKYYQECLSNLPNLNQSIEMYKNELKIMENQLEKIRLKQNLELSCFEIEPFIDKIVDDLRTNEENIIDLQDQIKMNMNYSFDPAKFESIKDLFGQLNSNIPDSPYFSKKADLTNQFAKSFVTQSNYCELIDIFDDYKIAVSAGSKINIYNLNTAEFTKYFTYSSPCCFKWMSESLLAVAGQKNEKEYPISIFKIDDEKDAVVVGDLAKHSDQVTLINLNKETNHLISGSKNGEIIIWDLKTYEFILCLKEHKKSIDKILVNSHGFMISFSKKENEINVWNIGKNYQLDNKINIIDKLNLIELTMDGDIICALDQQIKIFDYLTGQCINWLDDVFQQINLDYHYRHKFIKSINKSLILMILENDQYELRLSIFDIHKQISVFEAVDFEQFISDNILMLTNNDLVMMKHNPKEEELDTRFQDQVFYFESIKLFKYCVK